ncbi:glucose dehydrogenase [FAD, quinone]-like [Haemaphysalis longicornis]
MSLPEPFQLNNLNWLMSAFQAVGGGSAGCVLANRLSADPKKSVLLLEAGGMEDALLQVPLVAPALIGGQYDWQYRPEPQKNACLSMVNKRCLWARGLALGGSSSINFMFYTRGNKRDYDNWQSDFGAFNWSYEDVLPHFRNIETSYVPDHDGEYRGTTGEMPVAYASEQTALSKAFLDACEEDGYPIIDYNGRSQAGCSRLQTNAPNGERYSAAKAFITPILGRKNLHISLNSHVTKVLFRGKRAIGVRFRKEGLTEEVHASREVILSAGTIGSTQLLQLSGVGPKTHLEQLAIPVIADLPVGENLQDHLHIEGVAGTMTEDAGINIVQISPLTDYMLSKSGPYSIPASFEVLAFLSTSNVNASLEYPDVEIALQTVAPSTIFTEYYEMNMGLRPDVYMQYYMPHRGRFGFQAGPVLNRPKSRGYIKIKSRDPFEHPLIEPNYQSHPEDIATAVEGVKLTIKLIESRALRALGVELWDIPLQECASAGPIWSDPYIECLVRHLSHTTWHPCCTCPMGSDERAVVDHELRVRGLEALRVVDASVMPKIVSGNLNAPTMMIADKAAAIILNNSD